MTTAPTFEKTAPASFNNIQQQSLQELSRQINEVKNFGTPATQQEIRENEADMHNERDFETETHD